ncbi:MAG: hypothetical protein WCD86_23665 [Ktedonobacteraceae bacterium]
MADYLLLNTGRILVGEAYFVEIVNSELCLSLASNPEQVVAILDVRTTLDLADWLGIQRKHLYGVVMRTNVEAFKTRVRAEHNLPEPETKVIYVPPSSCDETLVELIQAAGVIPLCNLCQKPLCSECYNCHIRHCRYFIDQKYSHV